MQPFDTNQRIIDRTGIILDFNGATRTTDQKIGNAGTKFDGIGARTAIDIIISRPRIDVVVATIAIDRVIAAIATNGVIVVITCQLVA